jgi:hypothetical protein
LEFEQAVAELKREADEHPFDLGKMQPAHIRHKRFVELDGHQVSVQFTRTLAGSQTFYQLSIGRYDGNVKAIPSGLLWKIKNAILPTGTEISSEFGNTRQWILKVE